MLTDISPKKQKGIFPGWWMIVAGAIMCWWGYGTYIFSFGNFVKPLTAHFGWTRAQVSLAASLGRLEGGIEGPFGGIATDKFGPRAVNIFGFILGGLGFCLMYLVDSLWMFYLAWVIVCSGFNLGLAVPLEAALANWFVKKRGLMTAITRVGSAFSAPIVTGTMLLLLLYGWRNTFLIMGVLTWLLGIPLTWFFMKPRRPEYYGWLPDGERMGEEIATDTEAAIQKGVEYATETTGEVEFTVRQAMRDRIWWLCLLSLSLRGMVGPAISIHTVPLLLDRGVPEMAAAVALGSLLFVSGPARILFGWLADKVSVGQLRYLVMLATLLEGLGLLILIEATSMAWVWVFLIVYGLGFGANLATWPPLRARYWGRKAYATIGGAMAPFSTVVGVISPVYAGWVYDTTGSYTSAFSLMLILLAISIVIMYFATPPKPPEKVGKITELI